MSAIYLILILCFIDRGNSLKDLKVCYDIERNIEYCCSDYKDTNGICTECKIGFGSIRGNPCSHCQDKRFVKRFLHRCYCNEIEERCDHVQGCVPKFVLSVFELGVLIIWPAQAGTVVTIGGCLGFTCFCKKRNKIHVASSSYLQVVNGSYGTVIDSNGNNDRSRHLSPYVSLVLKNQRYSLLHVLRIEETTTP